MRWALLCWLFVALPAAARKPPVPSTRTETAPPSPSQETPEDRLARARQTFLNNDFAATVSTLRGLVYPDVLLHSEEDVRSTHRLLALSYYLSRNEESAEREFTILLALRPDFALDPVVDPPQAIAFLERLRARQRQRLDEIERRRRDEATAAAREEERRNREAEDRRVREAEERARRSLKPVTLERHHRWLCLVPLGAGQFQNGEPGKGGVFLATQLALGATSLVLWSVLVARYDFGHVRVPSGDEDSAKAMQIASVVAGGLFWADVLWGVIDALAHFQPEVRLSGAAPVGASPTRVGAFVPTGGGAGLSLQGAF